VSGRAAQRIVLPGDPLVLEGTALRPWRDTDVDALVAACQDPEIARWTRIPVPYGPADARAYLRTRYDAAFAGLSAPFAIVETGDGALLGSITLLRVNWRHRRAMIGYWLAVPARGRGHATRALRLASGWGMVALGLERIGLLAAVVNRGSQQVALRAGFRREAVLRSYLVSDGRRQDMVMFGLLSA